MVFVVWSAAKGASEETMVQMQFVAELGSALGSFVWGPLADRWSGQPLILIGSVGTAASLLLLTMTSAHVGFCLYVFMYFVEIASNAGAAVRAPSSDLV